MTTQEQETEHNNNFSILFLNNIDYKYAKEYAKMPSETINYLLHLSKSISQKNAFEILTTFRPFIKFEELSRINKIKILKNNYYWTIYFLHKQISPSIIKILLKHYSDFYYLELVNINNTHKNSIYSYQRMIESINYTTNFKLNFYKLRAIKMPHINAYNMCRIEEYKINNIIDLVNLGYTDLKFIEQTINFTPEQIDFLKFSKLGFATIEDFNKYVQYIYENAINNYIIL